MFILLVTSRALEFPRFSSTELGRCQVRYICPDSKWKNHASLGVEGVRHRSEPSISDSNRSSELAVITLRAALSRAT